MNTPCPLIPNDCASQTRRDRAFRYIPSHRASDVLTICRSRLVWRLARSSPYALLHLHESTPCLGGPSSPIHAGKAGAAGEGSEAFLLNGQHEAIKTRLQPLPLFACHLKGLRNALPEVVVGVREVLGHARIE